MYSKTCLKDHGHLHEGHLSTKTTTGWLIVLQLYKSTSAQGPSTCLQRPLQAGSLYFSCTKVLQHKDHRPVYKDHYRLAHCTSVVQKYLSTRTTCLQRPLQAGSLYFSCTKVPQHKDHLSTKTTTGWLIVLQLYKSTSAQGPPVYKDHYRLAHCTSVVLKYLSTRTTCLQRPLQAGSLYFSCTKVLQHKDHLSTKTTTGWLIVLQLYKSTSAQGPPVYKDHYRLAHCTSVVLKYFSTRTTCLQRPLQAGSLYFSCTKVLQHKDHLSTKTTTGWLIVLQLY